MSQKSFMLNKYRWYLIFMSWWLVLVVPAYALEAAPDFINGYGSGGIIGYARSVAVDSTGNVYVADGNKSRIAKFNSNGDFIKAWGHPGSGAGEFNNLMHIAISGSTIYAADKDNNRIQKFDVSGGFLGQISTRNPSTEEKFYPWGVTVDSSGNLYITDQTINSIIKFDQSGNYLSQWGSNGSANGQFQNPSGLRVDVNGYIYVADSYNHRVQKFDSNGVFITKWGSQGTTDGRFSNLEDLALDSSGSVYVTDSGTQRVQIFSSAGVFQSKWGAYGSGLGQLIHPNGIATTPTGYVYVVDGHANRVNKYTLQGNAISYFAGESDYSQNGVLRNASDSVADSNGNIYVVDFNNDNVQRFDSQGNFILKWGQTGSGDGDFSAPASIAIDNNNNIYVADSGNNRIQKFNSSGGFITSWGSYGTGNGQFNTPTDLAVDSSNNVYVVDQSNNRVQKFNSNGVYQLKWGAVGTSNGQFSFPQSITIDNTGMIYIADYFNHRIQKFNSSGVFQSKWGTYGISDGQLSYPESLAFYNNSIFVTDSLNRVQKFTSSGLFLARWGSDGYADGYFANINGVALDAKGTVYVTDQGTGVQLFAYPPALIATTSSTNINLVWNDPSYQETGFRVERCAGATCTNFAVVSSPAANVLSFNNTGLVPSTTYRYRIRAVYGTKLGAYSPIITATTRARPIAPNSLVVQVLSGTQVRLTWRDASSDETNFSLERCAGASCTNFAVIATLAANTTTFTNTGLVAGTTYRYRIRGYRNPDYSAYSNIVQATPIAVAAPTELSAAIISSTRVQLDWVDNSLDETNFRVERCAGATCTNFVEVATVPDEEATTLQTGLVAGTTYRYRVRAYRVPEFSTYSNIVDITPTLPNALTSLQTKILSSTQVRLTWALTNLDESEARIERCAGAGCTNFAQVGVVSAYTAVYINGSLTPNTLYRYRIRAYRNGEYSAYSSIVEATPKLPVVPTNLRATVSAGQAKLSWVDNSRDETNFRVERCTGVGCTNFAQIATTAANKATYTQAGLVAGTTYRYRVRAYRLPEYSAYSNIIDVRP